MSWSVGAIGKVKRVGEVIEQQFEGSGPCSEPEETVRQAAGRIIADALAAQAPDSVVSVSASGSQSSTYVNGTWGPPYQNTLVIEVKPQFGFVE